MQFHFKTKLAGETFSDTLFFAKKDKIIEFDYGENKISVNKELAKPMDKHPLFFQTNDS